MAENYPLHTSNCCCCRKKLSLKCFVMSCNHLMCDQCSRKQNFFYRCEIDNKTVEAQTLAFYNESISKVERISDFIAFSIEGICENRSCKKAALADFKQCGHKICESCIDKLVDSGEKGVTLNIRCCVGRCRTEVPLIFAEGILGRCPVEVAQIRNFHRPMDSLGALCAYKIDGANGILCSNESDIYVPNCSLNICYVCMTKHIYETHMPIYVNDNLLDVVPCINDNCTSLYAVKKIQKLAADKQQEYDENIMRLLDPRDAGQDCWFPACSMKARVSFSCGHLFCRLCYLKHNPEMEVLVRGNKTFYSICYVCGKKTRISTGVQLVAIDENDFLSKTGFRCEIYGHREALASTYCCNLSFCHDCLQQKLLEPVISRNVFGKQFHDVIKCKKYCYGGVPKKMIIQFLQKFNGKESAVPIQDECGELQTDQTNDTDTLCKNKNERGNHGNPDSFKTTVTYYLPRTETTGSNKTPSGQQGKSSNNPTNEHEMSKDEMSDKNRVDTKTNGEETSSFAEIKTDSPQSRETDDTNNLQKMDTDDTHCSHKEQSALVQAGTPSDNTISDQTCSSTDTSSVDDLFEILSVTTDSTIGTENATSSGASDLAPNDGLTQLRPVNDSSSCIICKIKAFAQLNCNHIFCLDCLCLVKTCSMCKQYMPLREIDMLMERLEKITMNQSASTADQTQTSKLNEEMVHHQTPVQEIKGVRNMGMTCYANSIFQILGQTPHFVARLTDAYIEADSVGKKLLLTHDLMVFLNQLTNTGDNSTVDKSILITLLQRIVSIDTTFERYQQNDCFEFLMCILERLKFENEELSSMFELTMKTVFKCKPCQHAQYGQEQISHSLLIPISKDKNSSRSVNAGLHGLLSSPQTFGKGVLPCKKYNIPCQTKVTEQTLELTIAPTILIVQIGRVAKQGFVWSYAKKENVFVRYDEEIEVPALIQDDRTMTRQIYKYKLYGVVLHSGSIDSGHYYSYVKKLQTDQWFLCNDSIVKPMSTKHVFRDRNAYLLFYEKSDATQLQTAMFQ